MQNLSNSWTSQFTSVIIIKKGKNVSSLCVLMITDNCKLKRKFVCGKLKNLLSRQNSSFGFKARVLGLTESCSILLKMAKLKFPWRNPSFGTYREHSSFHFKANSSFSLKTQVLVFTETTCCFLRKQNSSLAFKTRVLDIQRVSDVLNSTFTLSWLFPSFL